MAQFNCTKNYYSDHLDIPQSFDLTLDDVVLPLIEKARAFVTENEGISHVSITLPYENEYTNTKNDDEEDEDYSGEYDDWQGMARGYNRIDVFKVGLFLTMTHKHDGDSTAEYDMSLVGEAVALSCEPSSEHRKEKK